MSNTTITLQGQTKIIALSGAGLVTQEAKDAAALATAKALLTAADALATDADRIASEAARDLTLGYRDTASGHATTASQQATIATTKAGEAAASKTGADSAKAAAELARDAAQAGANVYASTAAGLAAVADGAQFMVVVGSEIIRYTRTNSTTATEVARYPAAAAVAALAAADYTGEVAATGRAVPGTGTGSLTTGATRLEINPFGKAGMLRQVQVYANGAGTAELKIFDPVTAPTSYNVVASYPVTLSTGLNTLTAGVHFPVMQVEADWTIGFYSGTASIGNVVGSGTCRSYTGNATGNAVAFNTSTAVGQWRAESLVETVVAAVNRLDATATSLATSDYSGPVTMGEALTATALFAAQNNTRVFLSRLPFAAVVEALSVRVDAAGEILLKSFSREAAGTWAFSDEVALTVAVGDNALTGFSLLVPEGGAVGIYPKTGVRLEYVTDSLGASVSISGNAVGTGITFSASSARLCVNVTARIAMPALPPHRVLLDERFDSAARLVASGGTWDYSGDGVLSPSGGGYVLHREELSNLDPVSLTVKFRLTDAASVFGVVRKPVSLTYGTAGIVDCAAGKLKLYPYGTAVGTLGKEAAISMTFQVGHEYTLTLAHEGGYNRLTLRNCTTHETATLTAQQGTEETGRCWGYPGIIAVTGTVRALWMQYALNAPREGGTLFVGDSITEGFNLDSLWSSRRSSLYATASGKSTINAGRGGSNTIDYLNRIALDLVSMRPAYVVILMGTNERDSATIDAWKLRMQSIISLSKAIGAQVAVGTLPPTGTPADATFINAANTFIRGFGFGSDVVVVDYSRALSAGNDGATINASLYLGDQVHPSASGHAAMAAQDECDAPMLRY